jgi:membrane protein
VGFMTRIWISTMVILVGAKINAELERQANADTPAGKSALHGKPGVPDTQAVSRHR